MGNLIPSNTTAGLVGVPSDNLPEARGGNRRAQRPWQQGKDGRGPTSGQASTTNDLLLRILEQLKTLNGANATPGGHAPAQVGIADMDGPGLEVGSG